MLKQETPILMKSKEFIASSKDKACNFSINLYLEEDNIKIESIDLDIDINSNNKYINKLFLKDWKNLNEYFSSCKNIQEVFKLFDKANNTNFSIIKNEINTKWKITFEDNYRVYPSFIILKKAKKIENNENNKIIEENVILKRDKHDLEQRIEILEDEINKIKYSLPFNLLDINLYKLEKIFNKFDSFETISQREHLGLINSGIKYLFKENIKDCSQVYAFSKGNPQNVSQFLDKIMRTEYCLIVIKTMNDRTFGAFHKKNIHRTYQQPMATINNFGYFGNIFDTKIYKDNAFVFSFNNKKIFFSDLFYSDSYEQPNFTINYDGKISCFKGVEYKSCNTNENINNNNEFAQASPYTNNNFNNANNIQFTQGTNNNYSNKKNKAQNIEYNGVETIDNSGAKMVPYSKIQNNEYIHSQKEYLYPTPANIFGQNDQNNLEPGPGASYPYGFGTENQASFQGAVQGQGTAEFSRNIYILSGTNQFIVCALEIFDIKIGK